MSFSKVFISVICLFLVLSFGVTDDEICTYYLEDPSLYDVSYTIADSFLQMPYWGPDPMGFRYGIGGVNTNGTIFIVGGMYARDIDEDTPSVVAANRFIITTKLRQSISHYYYY